MDIDEDITISRINLTNKKYDNMLKDLSDDDLIEYVTQSKNKELGLIRETEEIKVETKKNEFFDKIDVIYRRPWNKLQMIHKSQKIDEFLSNIPEINMTQRKELMTKFEQLLNDKIITKKNEINYDEKNGKIISIKRLYYDKNEKKYDIID